MKKLLKGVNLSKRSEPDDMSNRILKKCAINIAPGLTTVFQTSIDTGILPKDWHNTKILVVSKRETNIMQKTTEQSYVLAKFLNTLYASTFSYILKSTKSKDHWNRDSDLATHAKYSCHLAWLDERIRSRLTNSNYKNYNKTLKPKTDFVQCVECDVLTVVYWNVYETLKRRYVGIHSMCSSWGVYNFVM